MISNDGSMSLDEYVNLSPAEFAEKMQSYQTRLQAMFEEGHRLEQEIKKQLGQVKYEL